jgi:hypothetical protein
MSRSRSLSDRAAGPLPVTVGLRRGRQSTGEAPHRATTVVRRRRYAHVRPGQWPRTLLAQRKLGLIESL